MEALLTVTDLTKHFGETIALKGVQMQVSRGEIVGLVGENGAGKSTLVSILGGWTTPDGGQLVLDDEPFRPGSPSEALLAGVGSIQQQFEVDARQTIAHNIFRSSYNADLPVDEQNELARELMASVGLDFDPERRMGELVRAEQALVEVMRVMAEESQLVLMDEVASTFNDFEISQLHEVTRRLARAGRAVIYITHRIDEIASLVDRVVVLRDGLVTREFSPHALPHTDIAYEITQRELTFGERPAPLGGDGAEHAVAGEGGVAARTRLDVEGLSTPDGAVRGVSFALRRGEVFGLTGLRRAGMSELAAALVGAAPASWQRYRKDGTDVLLREPADALKLRIGYLSDRDDELGLRTEHSIAENLVTERENATTLDEFQALREAVAQVHRLRITSTGVGGEVGHLSVGNQQKVAVARWMGAGCDVLVLNHPTRGIDVGARHDITEMLHELAARGTSIVFISSDLTELLELSHRIGVMRDGELVSVQDNADASEDSLMAEALGEGVFRDDQADTSEASGAGDEFAAPRAPVAGGRRARRASR
ncbi:D-ribose transporter ATP-binding protein [Pseudoclavibacter endophyticus]|uniref:Sugar ABC transporter ATP-binding protein n=1 Tax=Pseudoclavibacter endophyticus TaxID=1778590 RepID=A0A6H9WM89_9MICO|nr:sugar ABC transporter ATP-binding protein [Pseudoclavibacter endophyticus]KAB1648921.1 sugar ABC transporter ATP-binding protein [Pseudoclavibacter endophyticus]GGA67223.1 D-ribose transporter ATP-binding protein [Pseudoclavibacter endophyticus]